MPDVPETTQKPAKQPTMSQYVVTVKSGKEIKNVDDAWAMVSPFCRLKVNNQIQTTTVRKDTKCPCWYEAMAFKVDSARGSTVEVEVFDGSIAGTPTSLGKCAVALDATRKERVVPLMTKNNKGANERAGMVTLGIVFEPGTANAATAAVAPASSAGTASPDAGMPSPRPTPVAIATAAPAPFATTPTAAATIIQPPPKRSMVQPISPAEEPTAVAAAALAGAAASNVATVADVDKSSAVPASACTAAASAATSNGKAAVVALSAAAAPPPVDAAATPTTDKATSDGKLAAVLVGLVMALMLLMQWLKNPWGRSSGLSAGAEPIELVAGSRIMARKSVASSTHYLYMTGDGNLILGTDPRAMLEKPTLWESGTAGPRCSVLFCRAVATLDGRIVVKRGMKDVAAFTVAEVEQLARHVAIKEPAAVKKPVAASSAAKAVAS